MQKFNIDLMDTVKGYEGRAVVIDFEKLSYISSAGLRSILLVAETARGKGVRLAICRLPKSIMEIIQVTGFDNIIDVYVSRSSAVAAVTE